MWFFSARASAMRDLQMLYRFYQDSLGNSNVMGNGCSGPPPAWPPQLASHAYARWASSQQSQGGESCVIRSHDVPVASLDAFVSPACATPPIPSLPPSRTSRQADKTSGFVKAPGGGARTVAAGVAAAAAGGAEAVGAAAGAAGAAEDAAPNEGGGHSPFASPPSPLPPPAGAAALERGPAAEVPVPSPGSSTVAN
jgi:hypothetical protein